MKTYEVKLLNKLTKRDVYISFVQARNNEDVINDFKNRIATKSVAKLLKEESGGSFEPEYIAEEI